MKYQGKMRFKYLNLCVFLICCTTALHADAEDTKATIAERLSLVQKASPEEAGPLKVKLAIAYYNDQDQEKAFKTYLEALDQTKAIATSDSSTPEDQLIFDKALKIYMDHTPSVAGVSAQKIYKEFAPELTAHPDNYLLGFIVAAAYANLNKFDDFFDTFYHSYRVYPDHWLAYKTKAVLHIKLLERARTAQEREAQKKMILANTLKAIDKNPHDTSLYKLMMAYSPEEEKEKMITTYLNKIINNNIVIPRTEIAFYVQQAVSVRQYDLAQRIIDKGHEWYQYSQMLNAAQQYLDKHK